MVLSFLMERRSDIFLTRDAVQFVCYVMAVALLFSYLVQQRSAPANTLLQTINGWLIRFCVHKSNNTHLQRQSHYLRQAVRLAIIVLSCCLCEYRFRPDKRHLNAVWSLKKLLVSLSVSLFVGLCVCLPICQSPNKTDSQ